MLFMALFFIVLIYEFCGMLIWSVRAAWGIAKVFAFVVLLPAILIGLAFIGLFYVTLGLVILFAVIATIGGIFWL